jgi:alpha-tubulin suppressor-like RCC1 family protein
MGRHLLVALLATACYRVEPRECQVTCALGACPAGLVCRADGFCHSEAHTDPCGAAGDAAGGDARADGGADGASCSTRMVEVIAGFKHTCARADDGAVWCWGMNAFGEHGDGTVEGKPAPARMQNWPPAVGLAAGQHHLCVLGQTGRIQCAGNNQAGQLGDGSTDYAGIPVEVVGLSLIDQVTASGGYHTCARTGGQLWCWGDNAQGQLGDASMIQRHTPVRVALIDNGVWVANGWRHGCAVRAGGSVYCWGYGALGNGAPEPQQASSPVQAAASGYLSVAGGLDNGCGVRSVDGGVFCWGWNADAQCGNGTNDNVLSPADTGLRGATRVTMGPFHSCALLGDGTVRCWGKNENGQIGNGAVDVVNDVTVPAQVVGLTDAVDVDLGENYSCAVRSDGSISCWGGNDEGQLGLGSLDPSPLPASLSFVCPAG